MALLGLAFLASGANAAYPGGNGLIAFSRLGQIWAKPSGFDRPAAPLTTAGGFDPKWSPDGTRIAFHANRSGLGADIWVMNADGGGQTQLTHDPAFEYSPSWSPDGRRIVFNATGGQYGDDWELVVMNADGTSISPLTRDSVYDFDPAWSPDGSEIAFSSDRGSAGRYAIWAVHPDGTGLRQITFPPQGAADGHPDWRADGARLIFSRSTDTPDNQLPGFSVTPLMTVRPDGGDVRPIGDLQGIRPGWAPDGTRILFLTRDSARILSDFIDGPFDAEIIEQDQDPDEEHSTFEADWQPVGPLPDLSTVSGTLVEGAPGATITVAGSRFVPRSVVRWNGADRPTTFVSPTSLSAQLTAADLARAGSGAVTVFTSPVGGGLSQPGSIAIAPGPKATISSARFVARWGAGKVRGTLTVSGVLERSAKVELALLRAGKVRQRAVLSLPAGSFTRRMALNPGLLPGRYTLRIRELGASGRPLTGDGATVVLAAPPQGALARALISTVPNGPAVARVPRSSRLFARFVFAARPKASLAIVTTWYHGAIQVPGAKIRRPFRQRIDSLVRRPDGPLPSGQWRCVLSVGGKVVGVARVRLG